MNDTFNEICTLLSQVKMPVEEKTISFHDRWLKKQAESNDELFEYFMAKRTLHLIANREKYTKLYAQLKKIISLIE